MGLNRSAERSTCMEEKTRKQRKTETDDERAQRLEREERRRAADVRAEDASIDDMVRRSIDVHGA
jgi:hypothetical protein